MDQYMDSYGDNITIGCLGGIAYYRLRIFLFSPCGNEVKMCVFVCVCVCVCVCEKRWTVCVCSSLDVYVHLSMNESIECVCVCTNLSMCYERV